MKDRYDSFAALSAAESEYRIIYEEKREVNVSSSLPTAAELNPVSVSWCGHFLTKVQFTYLKARSSATTVFST